MKTYNDLDGDSGVLAYEYGEDWIRIQFKHGATYEYTLSRIGTTHLREMKRLADAGDGLNRYINTHPDVKEAYSVKQ